MGDQCAQWFLGSSLGIHRTPLGTIVTSRSSFHSSPAAQSRAAVADFLDTCYDYFLYQIVLIIILTFH